MISEAKRVFHDASAAARCRQTIRLQQIGIVRRLQPCRQVRALFDYRSTLLSNTMVKRKASQAVEVSDEDTIRVAPLPKRSVRRKTLDDLDVSQAQNGRYRTLQCVLIPRPTKTLLSSVNTPKSTSVQQRASASTQTPSSRPQRSITRKSIPLLLGSEDELATLSTLSTKARNRKAQDEDADFEDDEAALQSEASSVYEEGFSGQEETSGQESEEAMSSDEGYDSAPSAPKSKRKTMKPVAKKPVVAATGTSKPSKTGKTTGSMSKKMHNISTRLPGEPKGLDTSLPPMANVEDAFLHSCKVALEHGLKDTIEHVGSRPLRCATMCSGTESPLLALRFIQNALRKLGWQGLEMDHQFSAEIVPVKQAFIERNHSPPILFRDVTELTEAKRTGHLLATTAYGAKVPIPGDIDMVIAGTSCVDFSNLNNFKKSLDRDMGGESSKTFFAMLDYCEQFRPAIVVLENTKFAQWDKMIDHLNSIGYETTGAILDTKDFVLPHTRQRGYMVCFDKSKISEGFKGVDERFADLIKTFRRLASSPVTDWILPDDAVRSKQHTSLDDGMREYEWGQCKLRHIEYRRKLRLGIKRPFTEWDEGGAIRQPEHGFRQYFRRLPERVKDCNEIALLRKAPLYDARFKTRMLDFSQNIDMFTDATQPGIIPCITPSGQYFVSDAQRALLSEECLGLQGIPQANITLTTETSAEIQDLAGNAMSTTVVGAVMLAGLILGRHVLPKGAKPKPKPSSEILHRPDLASVDLSSSEVNSTAVSIDLATLCEAADLSARRCFCESSQGIATKPIQTCMGCGHSTCTGCGGNPAHQYRLASPLMRSRVDPIDFEKRLRSSIPLRLSFANLQPEQPLSTGSADYDKAVNSAFDSEFRFSSVRRRHQWTVIYSASSARLELVLDGSKKAQWFLYALPDTDLPIASVLRKTLQQPVGKCTLHASLLDGIWQRRASAEETRVNVRGEGKVPSWRAKLGLVDFQGEQVWKRLHVTLPKGAKLLQDVSGLYRALPDCGTAEDSLYQQVNASKGKQPIYLFLDPTRTGDATLDSFVFAHDKERIDYGEDRRIIASLAPKWRPLATDKAESTAVLTPAGIWQDLSKVRLIEDNLQVRVDKPRNLELTEPATDCRTAELAIGCSVPSVMDHGSEQGHVDIEEPTAHADILEVMRRHLPTDAWHTLNVDSALCRCTSCSPERPALRWALSDATNTSLKPYEDQKSAAVYERAIKTRPQKMFLTAERQDGMLKINLGLNRMSMAHRALARLPDTGNAPLVSWRFQQDNAEARSFTFQPFKLKSTEGRPWKQKISMRCELFPKQQVVLAWMRAQESGKGKTFVVEEAEEASLPSLGWRAEVRAQVPIHVRGGICADHPGFGKTIVTLACVQSALEEGESAIIADLEARQQKTQASGLLPVTATLIVTPRTLVKQWTEEINDKLDYDEGDVIVIMTQADLNKYTLEDFQRVKIIIANRTFLSSDQYLERLANFAAMPGPAAFSGRALSQWLKHASTRVRPHLKILHDQGISALRKHIKDRYAKVLKSEDFQAVVPSRRLVGKEFDAAHAKPKTKESRRTTTAASTVSTDNVDRPLFEMFYWNRVVVDEFHQNQPRDNAAIKSLQADKRWGLSGTPALTDFYDIAHTADALLGIPLPIGSDTARVMTGRNMTMLHKEMTDFERFDAMRQPLSDAMHARMHEHHQGFLDAFMRQNVMDFAGLPYSEHLVPVTVDTDHQAVYTEFSHNLSSQEMSIRKAKASKTTERDERFNKSIEGAVTAEEALSRLATAPARALNLSSEHVDLVSITAREIEEQRIALIEAATLAQAVENRSLAQWKSTILDEQALGDREAIDIIQATLTTANSKTKTKKGAKKAQSKVSKEEADVAPKSTDKTRGLTAPVMALAEGLCSSIRAHRYFESISRMQQMSRKTTRCDSQACRVSSIDRSGVSALCGHLICKDCYMETKKQHKTQCPAPGCDTAMHDYHMLWSHTLDHRINGLSRHGQKFEAAIAILKRVASKGERAILFVQYEQELDYARDALDDARIAATVVSNNTQAGSQVASFQANDDTVIVLNASDETSAGLNLQIANHVIFLSPLLRDSQYIYEATMAQAIGRARRHGQKKHIHVYRLAALHTIDVDILEHRERRTNAITEQGIRDIKPPAAARQLEQHDPPQPDRVQLVRQDGNFSLQPKHWLYKCGANEMDIGVDGDEVTNVQGMVGRDRVAGWEDFSSQVKFSRAFTANDG